MFTRTIFVNGVGRTVSKQCCIGREVNGVWDSKWLEYLFDRHAQWYKRWKM